MTTMAAKKVSNARMPKTHLNIAEYISNKIDMLDLKQLDLADALGYKKPNMITMLKQGKTKVPINKVPALASALKEDPSYLLHMVMSEYQPEIWNAIQDITGTIATDNERDVLDVYRAATKNTDPKLTPTNKKELKTAISKVMNKG